AKAASSAAAAVMLDGTCAEGRTSLAHVKATQDWDWHGAEREFQMAIGFDPRYATGHHWYATSCLVPLGRLDEALDAMRIAPSPGWGRSPSSRSSATAPRWSSPPRASRSTSRNWASARCARPVRTAPSTCWR